MKGKKAQAYAIVIILLIIILVLIAVMITAFFLRPDFFNIYKEDYQKTIPNIIEKKYEIECNPPYINVGNICCLDSNYNRICDNDEVKVKEKTYETRCEYPYIQIGNSCCLDDNNNGRCDKDDYYINRDRISSLDMDFPFDLSSVDVQRDELRFRLVNEGNEDYIIEEINVDECDREGSDITIKRDDRKSFTLDCDFSYGSFNSDIEIDYTTIGGNQTLKAEGRVKGYIERYEDVYYDRYYDY